MAVSTSSYFSNSIVGVPQLGADIDLYEGSTNPKYAVGFGFTRGDGNKFRYGHFGALTAAGTLVAVDVSESNFTKANNVGAPMASLVKLGGEIMTANTAGSRYMQLVITASNEQFAGGYITITTGSGSGYTYHIRANDATANQITGQTIVTLHDPIVSPIDSNSDLIIAGSAYANLEGATTTDAVPAGVAMTGNSASAYGWICTHGIQGVLQDINIGTVGKLVALSTNTTGAVQVAGILTGSNVAIVGYLVEAGSSADYSLVYLTIE